MELFSRKKIKGEKQMENQSTTEQKPQNNYAQTPEASGNHGKIGFTVLTNAAWAGHVAIIKSAMPTFQYLLKYQNCKEIYPSINTIAEATGWCRQTTKAHLIKLKELGYINFSIEHQGIFWLRNYKITDKIYFPLAAENPVLPPTPPKNGSKLTTKKAVPDVKKTNIDVKKNDMLNSKSINNTIDLNTSEKELSKNDQALALKATENQPQEKPLAIAQDIPATESITQSEPTETANNYAVPQQPLNQKNNELQQKLFEDVKAGKISIAEAGKQLLEKPMEEQPANSAASAQDPQQVSADPEAKLKKKPYNKHPFHFPQDLKNKFIDPANWDLLKQYDKPLLQQLDSEISYKKIDSLQCDIETALNSPEIGHAMTIKLLDLDSILRNIEPDQFKRLIPILKQRNVGTLAISYIRRMYEQAYRGGVR